MHTVNAFPVLFSSGPTLGVFGTVERIAGFGRYIPLEVRSALTQEVNAHHIIGSISIIYTRVTVLVTETKLTTLLVTSVLNVSATADTLSPENTRNRKTDASTHPMRVRHLALGLVGLAVEGLAFFTQTIPLMVGSTPATVINT